MMQLRTALATATLFGLLSAAAAPSYADKDSSVEIYKRAKKKYNLGDFEQAIVLFKQAYDEFEAPAYLYNIAQAYRQLNNCPKALFFYERFLAEKPGSDQEATIKGYVTELRAECGTESTDPGVITEVDDPIKKPGGGTTVAEGQEGNETGGNTSNTSGDTGGGSAKIVKPIVIDEPRGPLVVASAEVGIALFQMGDVAVPVSPSLRLGAAYPISTGTLALEAGIAVVLSNMSYQEAMGDSSVLFSSYLVNARASYALSSLLRVGGELGIGLFRFASVEAGNPFTTNSSKEDAATTVALRIGASAQYALSEDMDLSLSPAFEYAGAHEALAADIGSVTNVQLLGGLRYRW